MVELSTILATTVSDFVGYALFIAGVMILYYVGKFIFADLEPPSKEAREKEEKALEGRIEKWKDWHKKKKDEAKKKADEKAAEKKKEEKISESEKALHKREKEVEVTKSALIESIGVAEDVALSFAMKNKNKAVRQAWAFLKKLNGSLKKARGELRDLRKKQKDDVRQFFDNLVLSVDVALQETKEVAKIFPEVDDMHFEVRKRIIAERIGRIREICGKVLTSVDSYIKEAKAKHQAEKQQFFAEEVEAELQEQAKEKKETEEAATAETRTEVAASGAGTSTARERGAASGTREAERAEAAAGAAEAGKKRRATSRLVAAIRRKRR